MKEHNYQERFTYAELLNTLDSNSRSDGIANQLSPGVGLYRNLYRSYGRATWDLKPAKAVRHFFNLCNPNLTNKTVLELGAGTGKNIIEFIRLGVARAVAVEIDSIAVQELMQIAVALEEAGFIQENLFAVYREDALNFLKHSTEQFDYLVAYGILHVFKNVTEQTQFISSIQRRVRIGGYIIIQSLTNKYPHPKSQPELDGLIVTDSTLHEYFGTPNSWEILHFDKTDIQHSHAGADEEHRHGSVRMIVRKLR